MNIRGTTALVAHVGFPTDGFVSPEIYNPYFEEAGDWAVKTLQSYGVQNVHKERWKYGRGWTLTNFNATMTEPRVMPLTGAVKAWWPGTPGSPIAAGASMCGFCVNPQSRPPS